MLPQAPDIRWKQRLQSYRKALGRLTSAANLAGQRPLSELEQQGLIQAFEFTHELAWNTMKDILQTRAATSQLYGLCDVTREAFAASLIVDGDVWMTMIAARNLTTHTYNEELAAQIAKSILETYLLQFASFERTMTERESENS